RHKPAARYHRLMFQKRFTPTHLQDTARLISLSLLLVGALRCLAVPAGQEQSNQTNFSVSIHVDAAHSKGELKPIWRFFGYDEPNFTYMKDGQKLLTELSHLGPGRVSIRTHHLLTSGDGTPGLKWGSTGIYREDADGKPIYDWTIVDHIFDTFLER